METPKSRGRRRYRTPSEKRALVLEWKKSGKSASAFGRGKGISPSNFFRWEKEKGIGAIGPLEFVEVRVPPATGMEVGGKSGACLEVICRGGHVVRVPPEVDPLTVSRLVLALEQEGQ